MASRDIRPLAAGWRFVFRSRPGRLSGGVFPPRVPGAAFTRRAVFGRGPASWRSPGPPGPAALRSAPDPHPPVLSSRPGRRAGVRLFLKCESFQKTGSFKPRGALNKVLSLSAERRRRGLITVSAGNHAQAVAWARARWAFRARW